MHMSIEPSILYLGTPVVLVSSTNPDGSTNVAPISSCWFLGWTAMLGFDASSQTPHNLERTGECVLNVPSEAQVGQVDALALLTASNPVPPHKRALGYHHAHDKLAAAGLSSQPSELVHPPRVAECPIQLEATVENIQPIATRDPRIRIAVRAIEVRIRKVHVDDALLVSTERNRIDPLRWRPLMMSFRQFFGLGECLHSSRLAQAPESRYAPAPARVERPSAHPAG